MDWGTDFILSLGEDELRGVEGSLSPYMEALSGAWSQASLAVASTHCGFCPRLQLCQRCRELIDTPNYLTQSHSVHEFTEHSGQCEQRFPGHRDRLSWKRLRKAEVDSWGLEGRTPPIM